MGTWSIKTKPMTDTHETRLARAKEILEGLSVGDALGEIFGLYTTTPEEQFRARELPPAPWHISDDTNMALSIYNILRQRQKINQDALAADFVEHYDDTMQYNMGIDVIVNRIRRGQTWQQAAQSLFDNEGSYGNSSAMRVGPIGGYFADDLAQVVEQAKLSAEVTHLHPEGIAGAIAVAVAVAIAWQNRGQSLSRKDLLAQVMAHTPPGAVRAGLRRAHDIPAGTSQKDTITILGNGDRLTAHDSVPFALWSAGQNLRNYEEAIWQTIRAGGDVDTTCAIVGSVVVAHVGIAGIPPEWLTMRAPLPGWAFGE